VYLGPEVAIQPETTITLYTDARKPMAEDIAKWMGIPPGAIKKGDRTDDSLPDVIITVGQNFKLPGS
jgi:hypothetical protein